MRVGILSYPMLFQREGSLQIRVRETIRALNRLERVGNGAVTVELLDPCRPRLHTFDVVHVFGAVHGNYRMVEEAAAAGVPVVLSPLISPGWTRSNGARARVADRLLGNLTAWDIETSYAQARRALAGASVVLALGEAEKRAIHAAFLVSPSRVRVCPNGVSPQFFGADGALFRARTGIEGPFVLMASSIGPRKNQLAVAHALAGIALPFVLIGEAQERDRDYLAQLRQVRGVTCLGRMAHDDMLLASAFGAAAVVALPGQYAAMPMCALEALAAGTPVVAGAGSEAALPGSGFALKTAVLGDAASLRRAVLEFIAGPPPREQVSALVRPYAWDRIAAGIAECYAGLAGAGAGRASESYTAM